VRSRQEQVSWCRDIPQAGCFPLAEFVERLPFVRGCEGPTGNHAGSTGREVDEETVACLTYLPYPAPLVILTTGVGFDPDTDIAECDVLEDRRLPPLQYQGQANEGELNRQQDGQQAQEI